MYNNNVYKPTTTSPENRGYLTEHSSSAVCCTCGGGGRKRRLQCLLLGGAIAATGVGIVCVVLGGAAAGTATGGFLLLLGLALIVGGAALFVFFLRAQGRCNFAFWPNRAARLSATLINEDDGVSRSAAQITMAAAAADEGDPSFKTEERTKLMEADNIEAEKIAQSSPKVVLMDTREC